MTAKSDMEVLARLVAKETASETAKETVKETFLMLGVDISTPAAIQSAQNQFSTMRNLHYSMRHVRNVVIAGILSAAVAGALGAFWMGFKASAAVPAVPIVAK